MFSILLAKMCEGRDMEENVKLIGLFVARTCEENKLNFIHAMQNLGKNEG